WTLSWGLARTSWIDPDRTTVRRRWVWPPGPAARGGSAVATTPPAWATALPASAAGSSPAALARGALARPSRWAGILDAAPEAGVSSGVGSDGAASSAFWASALARASSARLRRCSGISVIGNLLGGSQRSADAAVLANPPEVDRHEDDDHEGQ